MRFALRPDVAIKAIPTRTAGPLAIIDDHALTIVDKILTYAKSYLAGFRRIK